MPIQSFKKGSMVCLKEISADENLCTYLHGLGLIPGVALEIVSDKNPFVVNVKGSKLALGSSVLNCLIVE
jgi:Fe2+ transport system protein FeoA